MLIDIVVGRADGVAATASPRQLKYIHIYFHAESRTLSSMAFFRMSQTLGTPAMNVGRNS